MNEAALSSAPLTIRTNFTWNFAGKVAYAASRAVILVLIAKLGSAAMVGQYALAFALTAPAFMLADLDLRSVLATDASDRTHFGNYLGLRLVTTMMAMLAVCVMAIIQQNHMTGTVILFVGIAKGAENISDIFFGLMQKHERLNRLGISLMIKGALSVIAVCVPLIMGRSLAWGMAGNAAAWVTVLLVYDIRAARQHADVRPRFDRATLWDIAKLSLPLGLVLLFASLHKNLSNYFIEGFFGAESLGYFSSMIYIMNTGSLIISALIQSTNARLARLLNEGDRDGFHRIYKRNMFLTAGMGACMLFASSIAGREILTLIYQPEYGAWNHVFILIMAASGLSYMAEVSASALTAARRFVVQPLVSGGVLMAGVAVNFLLVPRMGLTGAGLSVLITSGLYLAGNVAVLERTLRQVKKPAWRAKALVSDRAKGLVVSRIEAFTPEFLSEWRLLLDQIGSDMVFSDPDWMSCWWSVFGAKRELLLLAFRDGGRLAAVFPLMIARRHLIKRVMFIGFPQATHSDAACLPEYRDAACDALLGYLGAMGRNLIVSLSGLREKDGLFERLGSKLRTAGCHMLSGSAPSPVVRTGGLTYDALIRARFSSNARRKFDRHEDRISLLGKLTLREMSDREMGLAYALHDLRWQKKMDTSHFTSPKSRIFFTRLLGESGRRWRALSMGLYLDERLIAFQYAFIMGGRAFLYKSAHDEMLGTYSPGKMMKRKFFRRCIDEGIREIDLGAGFEEYKLDWTDEQENIYYLAYPTNRFVSKVLFFYSYLNGMMRNYLKTNRRLVLFKRNTLGLIRFRLKPSHWVIAAVRALRVIRRRGAWESLRRLASPGRCLDLRLPEGYRMAPARSPAQKATAGDAPELALLMGCTPEQIGKKFYQTNRCMLVRVDGSIACAAWVTTEREATVISDCSLDRRICREENLVDLLYGTLSNLPPDGGPETVLRIRRHPAACLRAALRAGFVVSGSGAAAAGKS